MDQVSSGLKLKEYRIILVILFITLAGSLTINVYQFFQPKSIVGLVDHKAIGKGTNESGEQIEWYTISLWLQRDDTVNKFNSGETIAYIVDKKIYDKVSNGDSVEGITQSGIKLDVLSIVKRNLE